MIVVPMRVLVLMAALAAGGLFPLPAAAQSAASSQFDHFATGFPLTGAHIGVECGSCHISGRFRGAPRLCAACHNGTTASGKTAQHPKTTNLCEQCHVTNDWRQVRVNHAAIMSNCITCHNGTIAVGKPLNHAATSAPCESCHKSTVNFTGTIFNHAGITAGCASCHNGTTARGLPPPHVPTATRECSSCHTDTTSFMAYTMNHTGVTGMPCSGCHSGAYVSQGRAGAQGKSVSHIATGAECSSCHTSTASWAGAAFTHSATDTNCVGCHNGRTATGLATPPHIPTAAVPCSNCHTSAAPSFATYTMSHAAVTGVACSACHGGAYVSQGTSGAQSKSAGHVTTQAECSTCHNGTTSWAGATFVHAASDTNCVSCHNGVTAAGLTTPPHIPTAT